ncbi:MAG: uroporphyrinogen-III synthase [Elusimicrobia bacterium]|nr:uroporphyrinogen-III synthase [Elusimicrobiota bacterium]
MPSRSRLLQGKTILVTRPRPQAEALVRSLRRLGAKALAAPAIRIAAPASWTRFDRALRNLAAYDTLVFTSANAADRFFERARRVLSRSARRPRRLYAIGPATARALGRHGWKGVRVPETYEGKALADFLGDVRGRRILIPRARVARDVLPRLLGRRGARVDVVEAYRTLPDSKGLRVLRRAVRGGGADAVAFTSSSTASHFLKAVGAASARRFFKTAAAVSIGPITSAALHRAGIRRVLEAEPYTTRGIVLALKRAARRGDI